MSRTRYYILHRGIRKGPYSSDRLYDKIHKGAIGNNTLCCEHKLLDQDPDAPWFPLSKILSYISPEPREPRRRRSKPAPTPGGASDRVNPGAVLAIFAGIGTGIFFLYFFSTPDAASASYAADSPEVYREILFYRATRIAGILAAILITVAGVLGAGGGSPNRE